ncbi:MAG: N-acetylmuramoyl-L-alanine amidase [Acidobacteriota bacterium]|jgi:N-acetylmuramoyl-L-alanine amidase
MGQIDRTKRRILRQAVQENLMTLRGLPPPGLVRTRPRWRRWALAASPLLVPAALLALALMWASTGGDSAAPPQGDAPALAAKARIVGPLPTEEVATEAPQSPLASLASSDPDLRLPHPPPVDPSILALGVRRIVLDPGHGGEDHGTTGPLGLVEKELTLDVALRAAEFLAAEGFEVLLTRDSDTSLPLDRRAGLANSMRGDVLVSIHVNWIPNRRARGVETYWLGPTDDPFIKELAAAENRSSGYSLADFRRLLEGIYADVRKDESRRLAEAVQKELYRSLARLNPSLHDRGVKTAPFLVLVSTEMPAILAEVGCLSNEDEARLLATPKYRRRIAEALTAGIVSYAQQRATTARSEGSS